MTQDELNDIWTTISSGGLVEGWGGQPHETIDTLRRLDPDALWERKKPDGKWEPVPGLAPF